MYVRRSRGFTLIELMIVVAIIAIIAAIATLSYLAAIDRGRQKKTVNDMRQIAAAWEARAGDVNAYTVAGAAFTFPGTAVAFEDLERALTPTYTQQLPRYDAWNHTYDYGVDVPKEYGIRSKGRDGRVDPGEIIPGEIGDLDCDIIYSNGAFVTIPGGAQKQ
ncbi:MAG TPA: prepilin-type N-terminal cleavage/methylation domain-containing protein [Thermoanaerobaculia bacterium]|jgi:type II secretion system protein G|nr:prepilin-type N-terminal cleavage/methylation domain-containing protein [Thermoanaerobaculia bacterium]